MSFKTSVKQTTTSSKMLVASTTNARRTSYVRNPLWPAVGTPTGDEVLALFAVFQGQPNHIALTISVDNGTLYRVQLGDGTDITVSSNTAFNATIDYTNVNLYSDPGLPYKIATVRLSPVTANDTFGQLLLDTRHAALTGSTNISGWLEVKCSFLNAPIFKVGGGTNLTKARLLENFEIYSSIGGGGFNYSTGSTTGLSGTARNLRRAKYVFGGPNNFGLANAFVGCAKLTDVEIVVVGTGKINDCTGMFNGCSSISEIPLFDTSGVTSPGGMNSMFANCLVLKTVPLFNTTNVSSMFDMFSNCYSLTSVPLFNTANVTSMVTMFQVCFSLTTVPLFNTGNVTSMSGMFTNCSSLISVPPFNTTKVTDMGTMFSTCGTLLSVPTFDTSNVTNMGSMFSACNSLISVPPFNTTKVTGFTNFVQSTAITSFPLLDTAAGQVMTGVFNGVNALTVIPAINLGGVTTSGNFNNIFAAGGFNRIQATGARFTHTIASNNLGGVALDEYYTGLPTVSTQTLTITGNYGSTSDTPTIATAKGWSLTGTLLTEDPTVRSGFYRWQQDQNVLVRAGDFVHGPGYDLLAADHETYQLPIDGWYWFDDEPAARSFLNVPIDAIFQE